MLGTGALLPPIAKQEEKIRLKTGAKRITAFFILTIVFAILGEHYLFIPPFMGMMVGLSFLMMLSYHFSISNAVRRIHASNPP